ncbi:EscI/YscI/HrpB family type III secretion system inner rod protein [Pseudomonas sp. 18.1.10]|uniref:EscI/YscI/HrpB family type III secretion system inner rod protein n=1 Tax=Pseudomonas sp. 18.1.10 TaxID=2969302 RepID=UPI002150412D|nr:EscI/YscI/HrpB family type III secretion system inner rod protein [Pseudomonas sp. 18.1.10]MCR4538165.1 EscI/YscI/HrpB family type III secretion system inner rod protein [Pseudomonas sp. 18.1.10]
MEIVDNLFLQKSSRTQHSYTPPEQSAGASDVSFFTSTLEGPRLTSKVSAKPEASFLMTKVSQHLSDSRDGFARINRSTKNGIDMEALGAYPAALNNLHLTSQLTVKCIAKATQCVDKLGNMTS